MGAGVVGFAAAAPPYRWVGTDSEDGERLSRAVGVPMQSTSVRIDGATHQEIKKLASTLGATVGATVALAVRGLRQELIGRDLRGALTADETKWLDADLG